MESQTPRSNLQHNSLGAAIVGLVIIAFGLNLLARNLGWTDAYDLLHLLWPVGLSLLGVGFLLQRRHALWGAILIFAGVWAYANQQHWVRVGFWAVVGPAAIVLAGGSVIWRALHRPRPPAASSGGFIRTFAVFSGSELRPTGVFEGADVSAALGGAKLDLSGATVTADTVTVDVFAMMGGIEIRVPRDWDVTSDVVALMGACVDKRSPAATRAGKHLVVRGYAVMGGVEIKD